MSNISLSIGESTGKYSGTLLQNSIQYSSFPSGTFLVSGSIPSIVIDVTNISSATKYPKYNARYYVNFIDGVSTSSARPNVYEKYGEYGTIPNASVQINPGESYTVTMQELHFSFLASDTIMMETRLSGGSSVLSYISPSFSIGLSVYYIE